MNDGKIKLLAEGYEEMAGKNRNKWENIVIKQLYRRPVGKVMRRERQTRTSKREMKWKSRNHNRNPIMAGWQS